MAVKPHYVSCGLFWGGLSVAQAPRATTCTTLRLRGPRRLPAAGGVASPPSQAGTRLSQATVARMAAAGGENGFTARGHP